MTPVALDVAVLIPVRWASSRFPGKPLAPIAGRPMLQHVYEACVAAVGEQAVFIATFASPDNQPIIDYCETAGLPCLVTPNACRVGTDCVAHNAAPLAADLIINVQGDEPLVQLGDIQAVIQAARQHPGTIVNAMCPITEAADFYSPDVPKVVTRPDGRLLYMSRAAIPTTKALGFQGAMKQVCIYGFPPSALAEYAAVGNKTPLEALEDIEILRFLELGYDVQMTTVSQVSIAVDRPEDIARVEAVMGLRCP